MPTVRPVLRAWHFLPARLTTHHEELAYLWLRRRRALCSDSLTLRDMTQLNERIEAHAQGLLLAGDALAALLGGRLAAADRDEVFAIAWPMLRSAVPAQTQAVLSAFTSAAAAPDGDAVLLGCGDALTMAPIDGTEGKLRALCEGGPSRGAALAALALARHGRIDAQAGWLPALLSHEDALVAATAWRLLRALPGGEAGSGGSARPYAEALRHPSALVRGEVLETAVWTAQPWVRETLLRLAQSGDEAALGWLAALAPLDAQQPVLELIEAGPAAAERCRLLARLGSFAALERVVSALQVEEPVVAAAALEGWTRITGLTAEGRRLTGAGSGEGMDGAEDDFAVPRVLPDLARVKQHWQARVPVWREGGRWNRGFEVHHHLGSEAQRWIDLRARWDFGARAAVDGLRVIPPPPVV